MVHPHFLAGVVFAWVLAYGGLAAFFAFAARVALRREPYWSIFAMHSLALAVPHVAFGPPGRRMPDTRR